MKNNKGFTLILALLIVLGIILVGGGAYYAGKNFNPVSQNAEENKYQNEEEKNNVTSTPIINSNSPTSINNSTTPAVKITYPTAGVILAEGQTYDITWTNSGDGKIAYQVYLENDKAGSIRIGEVSSLDNSYSWTVPSILDYMNGGDGYNTAAPVDGYRISFSSGTSIKDMNKYYSPVFKIVPKN